MTTIATLPFLAALCIGPGPHAEDDAHATAQPGVETPAETVAVPPPRFRTFDDDPIEVKQVVLDNGLTVMLSENHERPEVFGAVVIRTGGKNDPADNTGMAHYLEHMLFKGTTRMGTTDWAAEKPLMDEIIRLYDELGQAKTPEQAAGIQRKIGETVRKTYAYAIPNEFDKLLAELGGTGINAFTTEDETVYHNSFPASQTKTWLEIYAHRFEDPVFRLFPTELEAVYEEKNISMDRFEVKLFETFMREAFPTHPYGTQTVIGEVEHLKRPSLTAMRAYFDTFYVPNNMALVLSGDIDSDTLLPIIEQEFGAWKRGSDPTPRTGKVEPFDGRKQLDVRMTPVRAGAFGFRTVPPNHPDYAALTVIRELLYNDQRSGFLDQLVDRGALLILLPFPQEFAEHAIDVVFYAPKILGQSFRRAEKLVLEQYGRVRSGDFDEEQLRAIKESLRQQQTLQFEDNEERALAIASTFVRKMSWQDQLDYLERLGELTREDVIATAGKYFGDDYLLMRSRMGFPKKGRLEKPHYPPIDAKPGARSEYYREITSRPRPAPTLRLVDFDGDVEKAQVQPGVVVHRNENPINDTYTLQLRFGVGTHEIRELGLAAAYLQTVGSKTHSPDALKRELFLINTTLGVRAELERVVVELEGPEAHLEAALALVEELMHEPVADPKRLRQLRRELWGLERVQRRDGAYVAQAVQAFAFYGQNSPFLRAYGPRGARKLSAEQLLSAWTKAQGRAIEVRYVGQRSAREVADMLGATVRFDEDLAPAADKVVHARVMPDLPTVYFFPQRNSIQTHLNFGVDGDPVAEDLQAAADAYDEYMGGSMAGLAFQEIREFRALAYSARAHFVRDPKPEQTGYLYGYVGCQADKTFESIDVMMGLIQDMPRKPERMDALRAALVQSQETQTPSFRDLQDQLQDWRWLGYTRDPRRRLVPAYEALEFEDIERVYEQQVAGRPVTLTVVGDPRRFDVKRLEKYGEVVKLRAKDVFAP